MTFSTFLIIALVIMALVVTGVIGYVLFINPPLRRMRLKEMDKVQKMTPKQMYKAYGPKKKRKKT